MQIVIDIKPQIVDTLNNENEWTALLLAELQDIINNGIPLPKGHGRLIDADALKMQDISPDPWYSPIWGLEMQDIEDAPTIIDADGK